MFNFEEKHVIYAYLLSPKNVLYTTVPFLTLGAKTKNFGLPDTECCKL